MFNSGLKSKLLVNEIVSPISRELRKTNTKLKTVFHEYGLMAEDALFGQVFKNPDRLIRQAMILLPAKAIGNNHDDHELIKLCVAAEIFYSVIDLWDGIHDSEIVDRKLPGTHKIIDNSRAILAGDTLLTLALMLVAEIFPENMLLKVIRQIEKASYLIISEEIQKRPLYESVEKYCDTMKQQTTEFSNTVIELGAYLTKADAEESAIVEKCGYNLAMAYKIIMDQASGKIGFANLDTQIAIKQYAEEAECAISGFKKSVYQKSLLKLVEYFYNFGEERLAKEVAY